MKQRLSIYLIIVSVCFILGSCSRDDMNEQAEPTKMGNDAQKAVDVFMKYRAELNNMLSRSENEVTILDVVEMDIPVTLDNTNENSLSRSANTDQVKLHRISFSSMGKSGFSIVSADERVRSTFMYCEEGSIEDTAYIDPVAQYIKLIPYLCEDDVQAYYSGEVNAEESLSRATQPTIYLPIKTKWSQEYPYNSQLAKIECGGEQVYPRVGCTGIAVAQAVVYLAKDNTWWYPMAAMREVERCEIYPWGEYNDAIAYFINNITLFVTRDCDAGSAQLDDAFYHLSFFGFSEDKDYIFKKTNSLDKSKFYTSLQRNCPTLMSGDNGKDAHTWMLHGQRYNGSTREIYCNYGWGGYCDGWYSDWQRPKNSAGEQPFSGSFYRNNRYMYFLTNQN